MSPRSPIAVVTGSSSGIGRAIAVALAADGASVVVHTRGNRAGADETAALVEQQGTEATVLVADLALAKNHQPLVEAAWTWRTAWTFGSTTPAPTC